MLVPTDPVAPSTEMRTGAAARASPPADLFVATPVLARETADGLSNTAMGRGFPALKAGEERASRRMRIDEEGIDRCGNGRRHKAVDTVQEASVTGDEIARVLDPEGSFQG